MDMPLDAKDDDFDDLQEALKEHQDRPLLVWLMMAVALVAMAVLLAATPEASARELRPAAAASGALDFATLSALLAFGG
jgi:hypothetical protein